MNGWAVASVACAVAVGAVLPTRRDLARTRLGSRPGPGSQRPRRRWRSARPFQVRLWPPRERSASRRRVAVIDLADALASELRAGAAPRAALLRAAQDQPLLAGLAVAARSPAGDVARTLRELAALPGGGGAGDLAAAWLVCESTGAGLAAPAARLAGALRDEAQVRRELAAQLAGPKATVLLLAMLPGFGLLMGAALGADPVHLLFGTPVGPALLGPGLALEVVGVLWTLRITRRATPP